MDANIARAVYIRAGKQVLQWGKAYFWNPSDLINIQRKSFLDMTAFREGSSGVKVTVPFGTVFNIYGYWDITKITDVADSGVAGKAEFLLGGTEISLSAWAKKGFYPVYALDFSSRIWTIDIRGEASFSYGDNARKILSNVTFVTNIFPVIGQEHNIWVPRVSFGFTKSFDFLEVSDRISFTGEIFWNGGGYYDPEILNDTMRQAVLLNPLTGLYQPNWLSAYYFAVFASVAQFLITDLTFSFNAIVNAVDWSSALSAGLTWTPVYDFSVGFTLTGYAGDTNREYTVGGSALSAGLTATLAF